MKRIIVLFASIFLLSGCTATYKMTIDNGVKDELNIYMSQTEYTKFNSNPDNYLIMQYANQEGGEDTENGEKIAGIKYYDFNKNDNNYTATFKSTFDDTKLTESALIRNVFRNYTYRNMNDEIYIKTDKGFDYPYSNLDNITIILESPYKVQYSNADSQNGNQLIWNITKSNAANFYVEVNYSTTHRFDDSAEETTDQTQDTDQPQDTQEQQNTPEKNSNPLTGIITATIVLALSVGIIITVITLKIKKNQINKI